MFGQHIVALGHFNLRVIMITKNKALIAILFASLSLNTFSADSVTSLDNTIFGNVAKSFDLDPLLLYSVALTESAIQDGKGFIRPHPFVLRSSEGPKYYKTQKKAEVALLDLLTRKKSIDVGMMQVNLHWHPQKNPILLFNAEHNLRVASQILKDALASTTDPIVGVGRYHSSIPSRATWYGRRVWQTYQNLTSIFNN